MANNFDISRQRQRLKERMNTLPTMVGDMAVNFFKERFRAGGWYGNSFTPWQPRRAKAKRNKGRAILVDTGRLRRSIHLAKVTGSSATIMTDVPYARAHNEGFKGRVNVRAHNRTLYSKRKEGTGTYSVKTKKERQRTVTEKRGEASVKAHTRTVTIVQRQFMGESPYLNRLIERKITTEILKAFT